MPPNNTNCGYSSLAPCATAGTCMQPRTVHYDVTIRDVTMKLYSTSSARTYAMLVKCLRDITDEK